MAREKFNYYYLLVLPILWKYKGLALFLLGLAIGLVFGSGTLTPNDLLNPAQALAKVQMAAETILGSL